MCVFINKDHVQKCVCVGGGGGGAMFCSLVANEVFAHNVRVY